MPKSIGTPQVTFTLPLAMLNELDAFAAREQLSRAEVIRRAVQLYLERERFRNELGPAPLVQDTRHGPRIAEEIRVAEPNVILDRGGEFRET
jgi:Arc/MetJ-type ribon-helix-helix transcriptional regulator